MPREVRGMAQFDIYQPASGEQRYAAVDSDVTGITNCKLYGSR